MIESLLVISALDAALAVALGAIGAHIVNDRLGSEPKNQWETANRYQLFHALAGLLAGGLAIQLSVSIACAGWLVLASSLLFSGGLYCRVLSGKRWLAAFSPVGGIGMIAGWCWLAWALQSAL